MKDKAIVVKIGGATLGNHDTAIEDIVNLQKKGTPVVVVHGGGKLITEWLEKQGIATTFVRGERVTDKPTLEIATAVLAGLVNKDITAAIISHGGQAAGISGVDGGIIQGTVKEAEKGYVGAVSKVDKALLEALLEAGFVPVVSPIGLNSGPRQEGDPLTLNYNADVAAGEIAAAIGAERLIFLTDVPGVADGIGRLISNLTPEEVQKVIEAGVASGGMIPKLNSCLASLAGGGSACIIDGRQSHALLREIEESGGGTTIQK